MIAPASPRFTIAYARFFRYAGSQRAGVTPPAFGGGMRSVPVRIVDSGPG